MLYVSKGFVTRGPGPRRAAALPAAAARRGSAVARARAGLGVDGSSIVLEN